MPLRVATLNIWNRMGPWEQRLAGIRAGIRAIDPDVIGLQEVVRVDADEPFDQAALIADGFGYHAAFGKNDASNQLKYARTLSADKTVVAWCNFHSTVSGFDTTPVLLASGQAKAFNTKKVNTYGWQFAQTP